MITFPSISILIALSIITTACDQWTTLSQLPGQPQSAGRFGHSAVTNSNDSMLVIGGYNGVTMSAEVLLLTPVNCTVLADEEECLNETLCGWSEKGCTLLGRQGDAGGVSLDCEYGEWGEGGVYPKWVWHYCPHSPQIPVVSIVAVDSVTLWQQMVVIIPVIGTLALPSVPVGVALVGVVNSTQWSVESLSIVSVVMPTGVRGPMKLVLPIAVTVRYIITHQFCVNYCHFSIANATPMSCDPIVTSCLSHTSCDECSGRCLWCDSTHKCVHDSLYPFSFLYGQCLGWTTYSSCPG